MLATRVPPGGPPVTGFHTGTHRSTDVPPIDIRLTWATLENVASTIVMATTW